MFIPDPDFYPSRIPDLRYRIQKQQQKTGVKKNVLSYLCRLKNFTNLKINLFFMLKKKIWPNFSKKYRTFYPKNCHQALKNIGLGPGKKLFRIPNPWVKKTLDPGSGSATLQKISINLMGEFRGKCTLHRMLTFVICYFLQSKQHTFSYGMLKGNADVPEKVCLV